MAEELPGSSLIAVLVTDLVGSTERRARLGEVAADALDRSVHQTSSATVVEHGGTVVKGLGDGLLATFGSAADAVAAAIAVQQAVSARHEVGLRVGASVGDVARQDDGDVLGLPVVEAARLCGAAEPGQIVVADVVRLLAHGRAGDVFRSVGSLELKGLPAPLAASAVDWEPLPARRFPRLAPPTLVGLEAFRFVGRNPELGALRRTLRRAEDGRRRVALVSGEPGVGKSRLIAEALRLQASRVSTTLYGRCRPDDPRPLGTIGDLLDAALADWRAADLHAALGPLAATAARVAPSIAGRVGAGAVEAFDPLADTDEGDAFAAIVRLLDAWSIETPVFLVVEDVEHADPMTRRLLVHLAGADRPDRLALVVSYDATAVVGLEGLEALGAVGEVLRLDPLTDDEVDNIVEFAAGRPLDDGDRAALAGLWPGAGGNPLYLGHFLRMLRDRRLLVDDGARVQITRPLAPGDVPAGVRDLIAARIDALPTPIRIVLAAGAAVGSDELDPAALAIATGLARRDVLDALARAERLYFVADAARPGCYAFTHELVRQVLADR